MLAYSGREEATPSELLIVENTNLQREREREREREEDSKKNISIERSYIYIFHCRIPIHTHILSKDIYDGERDDADTHRT